MIYVSVKFKQDTTMSDIYSWINRHVDLNAIESYEIKGTKEPSISCEELSLYKDAILYRVEALKDADTVCETWEDGYFAGVEDVVTIVKRVLSE